MPRPTTVVLKVPSDKDRKRNVMAFVDTQGMPYRKTLLVRHGTATTVFQRYWVEFLSAASALKALRSPLGSRV